MAAGKLITALFLCLNVACFLKDTKSTNINETISRKLYEIFGNSNNLKESPSTLPNENNSENCKCVPPNRCSNHLNEDGIGVIDIRTIDDQCQSYLETCCPPENITNPNVREPDPQPSCGWRNSNGVGVRISGDLNNEANFGEFPWMIGVLKDIHMGGHKLSTYKCGGSLIHPRVVLTGAHCVDKNQETYSVRGGEWDTQTTKELFPHQDRAVKTVIIHPMYNNRSLHNDVALLILDKPFDTVDSINAICLPPQETNIDNGTRCWVTGWGRDQFGAEGIYQVILKKIDLPFVHKETCQSNLQKTRLSKYFRLHESFVCAGGEAGIDACKGDGGGPLVCPIPGQLDRYQQVGIVAWGIGCGNVDVPGAYVNVALFRNWIDSELSKQNLDTSLYEY